MSNDSKAKTDSDLGGVDQDFLDSIGGWTPPTLNDPSQDYCNLNDTNGHVHCENNSPFTGSNGQTFDWEDACCPEGQVAVSPRNCDPLSTQARCKLPEVSETPPPPKPSEPCCAAAVPPFPLGMGTGGNQLGDTWRLAWKACFLGGGTVLGCQEKVTAMCKATWPVSANNYFLDYCLKFGYLFCNSCTINGLPVPK